MRKTYNELCVAPSAGFEYIIDFIFALNFDAIEEKNGTIIVRSEDSLDMLVFALDEYAKKLSEKLNRKIELKTELKIKQNEDWIQKYKDSIQPVGVGNFYIRPDWEKSDNSKIDIIINPALAFGSGHHESTYGCILMLQKYLKKNDTLLDVGCGSGILGIVAAKLEATVDICDTDEQALQSSEENFFQNGVKFNSSWVGSVGKRKHTYDAVVANIIADVLIMLSSELKSSVKKDGYLILSGILDKYIQRVEDKFSEMKLVEKYKKNEWFTLVLKR
ncbi:MAG: 50S ribosomal protein L11 methyltransferase [Sulfurospirillum sp.]